MLILNNNIYNIVRDKLDASKYETWLWSSRFTTFYQKKLSIDAHMHITLVHTRNISFYQHLTKTDETIVLCSEVRKSRL